jgi:hypothetical protein
LRYTHHQPIKVFTAQPSIIIFNQDTFITHRNKTHIYANYNRAQDSLLCINDSFSKFITVKNIGTKYNWGGNVFRRSKDSNSNNYLNRIYKYPDYITILPNGNTVNKKVHSPTKSGTLFLNFGMPFGNHAKVQTTAVGAQQAFGFIGYALGISYYTKPNTYWCSDIALVGTSPFPFGAFDFEGEFTRLFQKQFSILYNVQKNNLHFGFGGMVVQNNWIQSSRTLGGAQGNIPFQQNKNISIGIASSIKYNFAHACFIGLQYKPTFIMVHPSANFAYQHAISICAEFTVRPKR